MDSQAIELIRDFGAVVLGWALGLGSAVFHDWWKERKKLKGTRRGISSELGEVAYRLVGVVFWTADKFGILDREILEWMAPQIEKYGGPNPKEGMLAGVSEFLKRSDAELEQYNARRKTDTQTSTFTPLLEASYARVAGMQIHEFPPDYAVRLTDILSHISIFNDVREQIVFYDQLTFAPELSVDNHARAVGNLNQAQQMLAKRARIIVDKISAFDQKYPPGG